MLAGIDGLQSDQKQAVTMALLMMLASFIFLAVLAFAPGKKASDLAVLFPPTMTLTDIAKAIAPLPVDFVRTGYFDSLVILRPRNISQIPALKEAGAWLVFDAIADGGCSFLKKKILS